MSLQNIGAANSDDAFYRYKMPRMITKIEGRGNGIKTNIVNMVDIAKALARPASYTTKYFGCELGAQSKFDEKTGISLVNGAHDTQKLAALLENFIKKYIQCYGCGNPETEIIITKTQMLNLKCAACGFVSDVDMRDKLTTFILKNPPEAKKGSKDKKAMRKAEKERLKEGEAVDEGQKKIKKDSKKKGLTSSKAFSVSRATVTKKTSSSDEEHSSPPGSQAEDNDADEEDDIQWQTDTSLEAAKKRIQEQLTAVTADMVILSTNDHEQKDKETKQIEKENAKTNGVCLTNDNSGYNNIVVEIKDLLQKGSKPSQVVAFVSSLAGSPQEIMTALFEALFDGVTKGFAKEVGKKKSYLAAVARDEASQGDLLLAIEAFCRKSVADVLKEVAVVAKVLYDADILEEEPIMQWYGDGVVGSNKNSAIWRNMYPFIEWLRSAESESEEE